MDGVQRPETATGLQKPDILLCGALQKRNWYQKGYTQTLIPPKKTTQTQIILERLEIASTPHPVIPSISTIIQWQNMLTQCKNGHT